MIKNRTAQLVFQTIFCTLGLVGIIACIGIFDDITNFRWDFYIHFTTLSNFFCIGIMVVEWLQTIKKKEDSYVTALPILKFIGMVAIFLTFIVFNVLLAGAEGRDPQLNWRIGSLTFHVILPIMYILDWFLFYEKRKVKWYYPISAVGFPLAYAIFIYIHAAFWHFDSSVLIPNTTTPLIYPYFFLNLETQGILGVLRNLGLLFVVIMVMGLIFMACYKLLKSKKTIEK